MKISLAQLSSYLQIPLALTNDDCKYMISIDTRKLSIDQPSIFIAIKGLRLDGHEFISQAIQLGAKIIIAEKSYSVTHQDALVILVDDTEKALGLIAKGVRSESNIPWIAVTGSAGKTTTRRFISDLLRMKGQVLETIENNNNQIGGPLTILELNVNHRFAVIEAGSNHPGEIEYLAKIIQPDIAVITNVGPTHIEFLGSVEGVAHEKASLFRYLQEEGSAIFNADTRCVELLKELAGEKGKTFGLQNGDICPEKVEYTEDSSLITIDGEEYEIPFVGEHYVSNFLAAYTVADLLGFEANEIALASQKMQTIHGRLEVLLKKPIYLIDDSYNASYDSMVAALKFLKNLPTSGRKIAVIGDMLELGEKKNALHATLVDLLNQLRFDEVIVSGTCWNQEIVNYKGFYQNCLNVDEIMHYCDVHIRKGDQVLVKASRSLRYDLIVKRIFDQWKDL